MMAKPTRLSPIRKLRERLQLSLEDFAQALQISTQRVEGLERSLDGVTASELSDIALVLSCAVEVVRGEPDPSCAPAEDMAAYGTLKVVITGREFEFPIDAGTYRFLSNQIAAQDIQETPHVGTWLTATTLDNKKLFINLSHMEEIELLHDNVEAMPLFHHAEVYKALSQWGLGAEVEMGPVVNEHVQTILQSSNADLAVKAAQYTRVVMSSGSENWHFFLGEEDTVGYYVLEMESASIEPDRLLRVRNEGYYVGRYVNLSKVALIEVPLSRYLDALNESAEDAPDE